MLDWAPVKKVILEELVHAVRKIENYNILEVPSQIVSEVTDVVVTAPTMDIKVEWTDMVLTEIEAKKDHHTLLRRPKCQENRLRSAAREGKS